MVSFKLPQRYMVESNQDGCLLYTNSFVLPLQHLSMAAHLLCLLTPPLWELHKEKQARRNKVRYGTSTNQNIELWCQHLIMLASKLAKKVYSVLLTSLSTRCPKCHGCVETQPCLNRSRGNALSAWRSAPDNIHSYRNCLKGPRHQRGMRTGTKIGISASKTIYQPSQAGPKTTGPKRSVLHRTLHKQLCSGTQPSDNDDTLTLPSPSHPPTYPLLHSTVLC